jgi:predicted MFS family arabinose efflux permease
VALAFRWTDARAVGDPEASFLKTLLLIWTQGVAMALASSGVGTITAFLALRYQGAGWSGPGLGLFGFGVAYLAIRFLFGGIPDRLGGYRTAVLSLLVEAVGLAVIWRAPTPLVAVTGAALTGLGYSLVFPSLGVEAMRRVSSDNRGLVLGVYLACFDLGLAIAGPVAGIVTEIFDLPAAFAAAAVAALAALVLTVASWARL